MNFSPAIRLLRIFSEQKAREHYLNFLGFSCEWEHRLTVRRPSFKPGKPPPVAPLAAHAGRRGRLLLLWVQSPSHEKGA